VDLSGEVVEVEPTSEDVHSDEAEGTPVHLVVHAPIQALHEAHISVP
jgi:hypothetical protein